METSTRKTQPASDNSQASESSQTAQDYIASQLSLELDAREALPYQFDTCTKPLGSLRQTVYACLTCTPPPASPHQQFTPAGVCYSCSISCHGEHNLVELFAKRDFVCDCGTTRYTQSGTPCSLRLNEESGRKGGVAGEKAREGNKYNQNFEGKFCGCGEEYDPEKEKGTMFQCLGLGSIEEGGCGEDWWHPECLMGLPRCKVDSEPKLGTNGSLETVREEDETANGSAQSNGEATDAHVHDEPPPPPGFPSEDDFDHVLCYKCVTAYPWIKEYAASAGFSTAGPTAQSNGDSGNVSAGATSESAGSKKRKAEDDSEEPQESKKARSDPSSTETPLAPPTNGHAAPKHTFLTPASTGDSITLFLTEDFREHLCRCPECFPHLAPHRQLLEEEESYEPPLSESDDAADGTRSVNSGSLFERGEAALSSMDRVRAIEGVMAYNHVKDKVKQFLKPYAESGEMVGAEDIKAYFAKLRGDEQALREAAGRAGDGRAVQGDGRREQGGY